MKCRDAIKVIAKKKASLPTRSFIEAELVFHKKTFVQLTKLVNDYGHNYSCSTVWRAARQFYNGPLPFKRKKTTHNRRRGDIETGSFWNKKRQAHWSKVANALGYKSVYGMLREYSGTSTELAKCLGVSVTSIKRRRKLLGIRGKI